MAFGNSQSSGSGVRKLGAIGIGIGIGAAIATPAAATSAMTPASLLTLATQEQRLASVSYRLSLANARSCTTADVLTGLVVHDLSEYDDVNRSAVARTFGLGGGIGVLAVAAGSPAEKAGLVRNDEIIAVDGVDLQASTSSSARAGSYDRVGGFLAQLDGKLRSSTVQMSVRRGGAVVETTLAADFGCGGKAALMPSGKLNAWSDGNYVAVTTKLMSFATDDELAFVVAHEMSHNILGHQQKLGNISSGLFSNFGRNASRIKATEVEADRYAITLMDAANCDLGGAAHFLERSGKKRWPEIATTHPVTGTRIRIVAAAIAGLPVRAPAVVTGMGVGLAAVGPFPESVDPSGFGWQPPRTAVVALPDLDKNFAPRLSNGALQSFSAAFARARSLPLANMPLLPGASVKLPAYVAPEPITYLTLQVSVVSSTLSDYRESWLTSLAPGEFGGQWRSPPIGSLAAPATGTTINPT